MGSDDSVYTRAPERDVLRRIAALVVVGLLVGLLAFALRSGQARARDELARRVQSRAQVASDAVATRVSELLTQARTLAERNIAGSSDQNVPFELQVRSFGFDSAVLVDGEGRVLDVVPFDRRLVGVSVADRYAPLRAPLEADRVTVSGVVPSAARGVPVVAFATPFDSIQGRRVFAGSFGVGRTPFDAYLQASRPFVQSVLYLIDAGARVIGDSDDRPFTSTLRAANPELAAASAQAGWGEFRRNGESEYFARVPVRNTPWSLVLSAPAAVVFAPTRGPAQVVPWVVLALLALVALALAWVGVGYVENASDLRRSNLHLAEVSRVDELTGAPNRRHLVQLLGREVARSTRAGAPMAVLMVDVDHFKRVNDTFGHSAGDRVLRHVASVLRVHVRGGDTVGRWGGEEFLAVLPATTVEDAFRLADRLRHAVATAPVPVGTGGDVITVTVSVGCAAGTDDVVDVLVGRADHALYRAKAAGRDRVVAV